MNVNKTKIVFSNTILLPPWLQAVVTVVIVLLILWLFKNIFKDFFTTITSKKISVKARLLSKNAEPYVNQKVYMNNSPMGGNVNTGVNEKGTSYIFTFELDNGKTLSFFVPKDKYDVAVEESYGLLTYQGKYFISFDGITEGTRIRDDEIDNNFVGLDKEF